MQQLIKLIAKHIEARIPAFEKSIHLARIDSEGRILKQENNSNSYVWGGIDDSLNNYFYIRHRDEGLIHYEELSNDRRIASLERWSLVRVDLRLVAVMRNADQYDLEAKLRSAIMSTRFKNEVGFQNGRTELRRSSIDSIAILKEESPKPKEFDPALTFVAFDFDLVFEQNETCCLNELNREICQTE